MALQCLPQAQKYETNIKSELIYDTSRYISKIVGVKVQPNKAIVGDNAFGHESGIHTHGVLNNPLTYEPISPELVGRTRQLRIGKHAGIHGMNAMLEEFGVKTNEEQSKQILESDEGKVLIEAANKEMWNYFLWQVMFWVKKELKKLFNYLDSLYLLELELCPMHL